LLPVYIAVSKSSGIYKDNGWVTTASFVRGQAPTIVFFIFWFVLLVCMSRLPIFNVGQQLQQRDPSIVEQHQTWITLLTDKVRVINLLRQIFILAASTVVMVFANILYCTNKNVWLVPISVLKLAFNWAVAPWMLESPWFRFGLTKQQIGDETAMLNVLYIFNNFLIPVFATSITSSDCYFHYFVSSSNLVSIIIFPISYVFTSGSDHIVIPGLTQTTTYTPPFKYNYQCTSSLLVNYTPVFVVLYVFMSTSYVLFDVFMRYKSTQAQTSLNAAFAT
jgi:hypothetical protein